MKWLNVYKMLTRQLQLSSYSLCKLCVMWLVGPSEHILGMWPQRVRMPRAFQPHKGLSQRCEDHEFLQTSNYIPGSAGGVEVNLSSQNLWEQRWEACLGVRKAPLRGVSGSQMSLEWGW